MQNSENCGFEERCYQLLKLIPEGKLTSYKEIANALDSRAYRAVGNAMRKNPNAPRVPCHRVVCSDGSLGGYAYGLKKKVSILKSEGIVVENLKILNFEQHFLSSSQLKKLF